MGLLSLNIFRRRIISPKCDRHPDPPTVGGGEGISLQKENDILSLLFISYFWCLLKNDC